MRIEEVGLAWFRGAAEPVALITGGKSVVVYGPNGSGKSSFVDGLEYVLSGGKVGHLAHEYSGRRQEKALRNTHAPPGEAARVDVTCSGNVLIQASLAPNGAPMFRGHEALAGWDRGRAILRQDEVVAFVHANKADKYTALLPLIGLGPLETTAVNLRALARRVRDESKVEELRGRRKVLEGQIQEVFAGKDKAAVAAALRELFAVYFPDLDLPRDARGNIDLKEYVAILKPVVDARVASLTLENTRYLLLKSLAPENLKARLDDVRATAEAAAAGAQPLLQERLEVLRSATIFGAKLHSEEMIHCPACGQQIGAQAFKDHVNAEAARLETALAAFGRHAAALARLADAVSVARSVLMNAALTAWFEEPAQVAIRTHVEVLVAVDVDQLRLGASPMDLSALSAAILPVTAHLETCCLGAPPSVDELFRHSKLIAGTQALTQVRALRSHISAVEALLGFLAAAEAGVREEIRDRSEAVIADISADMQRMWRILHPGEPIDEVRLYQPPNSDKGIDIALKFHGKDQPSPRVTLSEGHRNSLGLCVFFALAKRCEYRRPLILDDIVTSFDREHRGQVVDLLVQEFGDTQVFLFTHDYEWYVELSARLPRALWNMKVLMPWSAPDIGIRWSATQLGFDPARVLLDVDTMSAANKARALMDVHMAVVAERLEVPMPYVRGVRNDSRTSVEFLERWSGRATKNLKRRSVDGGFARWAEPVEAAKALGALLRTWGNAGSHGRYVARNEADRLIADCEAILNAMTCHECGTPLWHATEASYKRCDCGALRWEI